MRRLPPLATLRAFEAAARHLSFKRAADELAVTPTAISHQVRLLEDTLGQKLFERRTRRVILTAAGHALYAPLRDGFDVIAEAVERVRAIKAPGAVTLTATMAFTSKWLVPRVAAFRTRFPDINLRLLASDDVVDLRSGGADIAVRYGGGAYPGCRSQLLFQGSFAPVCSPRLNVRDPTDLDGHALIHSEWRHVDERTPVWPRWYAEAGIPYRRTDSAIVFSDETHAIQAAMAGQGIALVSLALVAGELATGVLVAPFGPTLAGHGFHVVIPDSRANGGNVEAVREWLTGEAADSVSQMPA
jgi:LysR family transcriptional regulator, glycine cleavage system transcriptional activator